MSEVIKISFWSLVDRASLWKLCDRSEGDFRADREEMEIGEGGPSWRTVVERRCQILLRAGCLCPILTEILKIGRLEEIDVDLLQIGPLWNINTSTSFGVQSRVTVMPVNSASGRNIQNPSAYHPKPRPVQMIRKGSFLLNFRPEPALAASTPVLFQ